MNPRVVNRRWQKASEVGEESLKPSTYVSSSVTGSGSFRFPWMDSNAVE